MITKIITCSFVREHETVIVQYRSSLILSYYVLRIAQVIWNCFVIERKDYTNILC